MARPIEATPVLEGEDAARLLAELEHVCAPEEAERRVAAARKLLAKVVVPDPNDRVAAE
jgi:hypothetical protein